VVAHIPTRFVTALSQPPKLQTWQAELRCQLCLDPATICMMEGEIICCSNTNPLKLTGHFVYQQFNIKQLYALPTLYFCVLYLSQNKQLLVPFTA